MHGHWTWLALARSYHAHVAMRTDSFLSRIAARALLKVKQRPFHLPVGSQAALPCQTRLPFHHPQEVAMYGPYGRNQQRCTYPTYTSSACLKSSLSRLLPTILGMFITRTLPLCAYATSAIVSFYESFQKIASGLKTAHVSTLVWQSYHRLASYLDTFDPCRKVPRSI